MATTHIESRIQYCQRCGERIKPGREVWLEMNSRTGTYHRTEDEVPASESQGWFPFGAACAKSVIANGGKV